MKYYNFIRSLKIREERRRFLRQIFHRSHVKNEKLKKKLKNSVFSGSFVGSQMFEFWVICLPRSNQRLYS